MPDELLIGYKEIASYLRSRHGLSCSRTTLWMLAKRRRGAQRFPAVGVRHSIVATRRAVDNYAKRQLLCRDKVPVAILRRVRQDGAGPTAQET